MEYEDDLEQAPVPAQAEAAPEAQVDLSKEIAELRQENKRLRLERTRESIRADHGTEILELIDDDLPLEKQRALAEKLAGKLRGATPAVQTEIVEAEPAPPVEQSVTEANLAAVAKGSASAGTPALYTPEEALQLAATDPARYKELKDAGAISLPRLEYGNDLARG
jgi:hypothetical protein